jgi:transcription-repair coupling factor (superfamily II helicase)
LADAPLVAASAALLPQDAQTFQPATSAVAARLAALAEGAVGTGLYIAASERRADEIGRVLRQFVPGIDVLVLPPWDCLPYDRASPSRQSMGRRMAVLARLMDEQGEPCILVTSPEAILQRVPPRSVLQDSFLTLRTGDTLSRADIEAFAAAAGYVSDDRVDEPGEIAILGSVVDVFPAAAEAPVRLALDGEDRIVEIKRFDPVSQRTEDEVVGELVLGPASELIIQERGDGEPVERVLGIEHRAPELYDGMGSLFDCLPEGWVAEDARARGRCDDFLEQVTEAFESQTSLGTLEGRKPLAPERLYLADEELRAGIAARKAAPLDLTGIEAVPKFAVQAQPGRAFSAWVSERLEAGNRVVLAGLSQELRPLNRTLKRALGDAPAAVSEWTEVVEAEGGAVLALAMDADEGFVDTVNRLVLVAASDVLGGRVSGEVASDPTTLLSDPDLRSGDVVIHEDHGLGVLRDLEQIEVAGAPVDAVRIEYHGGDSVLVPVEEFGRIWRYSAAEEAVSLDRLHTDAWQKRRIELSGEIDRTAEELVRVARERAETPGFAAEPPKAAYARFAARFRYPETSDQLAAIEAVLGDLASGRRMNRLVCGDVGFGKTEVALRAAAAVALSGKQVAVVAPTTVLARQHYATFRRRFGGTGIEVGQLSRLVSGAEAKSVKDGIADGTTRVVIGTHALAGKGVAFADLGLLIIDEEQKFGARMKHALHTMAPDAHLLTMTATPIPRTLQLAMVGVEDVSVIATPPARRRPIRTFLAPFDAATMRTALLREKRRGGQSFVVVPRIDDIAAMQARIAELAPELTVRVAHGEMAGEEMDEVMVSFADGDGDVLLATNIIESGLDVPRANTMLIWRADLFGLAQLHQLRGRVGRGRTQGLAYLLTDPDTELPDATRARLSTLEAHDRLGSGLTISARDLDLRGAGDLIGEEQTGHVKAIGTGLYQRLLARAVRVAKGELSGPDWTPELSVGTRGCLPESFIPDPTVRLNLYARLARVETPEEVEALGEELEDRFGEPPDEVVTLLEVIGLQAAAKRAGVVRVDLGPKAAALTFRTKRDKLTGLKSAPDAALKDGRLIWPSAGDAHSFAALRRVLDELA